MKFIRLLADEAGVVLARGRGLVARYLRPVALRSPQLDAVAKARTEALVQLIVERLPVERDPCESDDPWPVAGPALLARCAGAAEAIMALLPLERELDADILLRSLYEHAVTFAWLAIDPLERLRVWRKQDCEQRLKADTDCRRVGVKTLSDKERARLEEEMAKVEGRLPDLTARAVEADGRWGSLIPGMEGHNKAMSFRGLYAVVYRRQSAIAHPTVMGMNLVLDDLTETRRRVRMEHYEPDYRGPFGLTSVVLSLALFVAVEAVGWPERKDIVDAFVRHPALDGESDGFE